MLMSMTDNTYVPLAISDKRAQWFPHSDDTIMKAVDWQKYAIKNQPQGAK